MTTPKHSIIFVSGAGLPAWIWDAVRRELGDAYLTEVAARPTRRAAGLKDYAAAALATATTDTFTLVGHSAGGLVAAEVCRLAPERATGLLAISATIPHPGGSFISVLPLPNRWLLSLILRMAGTRPPESAIRGTLAHGIDEETVERLIRDLAPESQRYFRDRSGTQALSGRREYVVTTADKELPATLQRSFAARLGASRSHEIATGHLPMLEDPPALARLITEFVESDASGVEPKPAPTPSLT